MISAEPSRLGMDEFLPDLGFAHEGEVGGRRVLEIEFHRLTQIRDGLVAGGTEAGDVHVQALCDGEFVLAINAVGDRFHAARVSRGEKGDNGG